MLPIDVWQVILEEVEWNRCSDINQVALVCKSWRRVVEHTPAIWSHIQIAERGNSFTKDRILPVYDDAMLDAVVIRAQQCPLNVKVVLSQWTNETKKYKAGRLQHFLNAHSAKLASLHIVYTGEDHYGHQALLSLKIPPLSSLHTLIIEGFRGDSWKNLRPLLKSVCETSPSLLYLDVPRPVYNEMNGGSYRLRLALLQGVRIVDFQAFDHVTQDPMLHHPLGPLFRNIQSLHVHGSTIDINILDLPALDDLGTDALSIKLLAQLASLPLRRLQVTRLQNDDTFEHQATIPLDKLVFLSIRHITSDIMAIQCPALHSLRLGVTREGTSEPSVLLKRIFSVFKPRILQLHIQPAMLTDGDFVKHLCELTSLEIYELGEDAKCFEALLDVMEPSGGSKAFKEPTMLTVAGDCDAIGLLEGTPMGRSLRLAKRYHDRILYKELWCSCQWKEVMAADASFMGWGPEALGVSWSRWESSIYGRNPFW